MQTIIYYYIGANSKYIEDCWFQLMSVSSFVPAGPGMVTRLYKMWSTSRAHSS